MKINISFIARLLLFTFVVGLTCVAYGQSDALPVNGFEIPETVVDTTPETAQPSPTISSKRMTAVLQNGGPLMIPILFCSFVLVVFTFERLISLRKGRIIPAVFSRKFIEQLTAGELNKDKAVKLCEQDGSPIAQVFLAGAQKWGKASVEVEQAVLDEGERQSNHMRRYLRLINGIATVCPLLGLLGTVLGMIHAFDAIAAVDSNLVDPKILIANGISQALLTTAAGMTVAIPALIAYLYFSSRVDLRVMEIDSLSMKVVRAVCAESQIAKTRKTATKSNQKKAA